jgi:hypothetical protein
MSSEEDSGVYAIASAAASAASSTSPASAAVRPKHGRMDVHGKADDSVAGRKVQGKFDDAFLFCHNVLIQWMR